MQWNRPPWKRIRGAETVGTFVTLLADQRTGVMDTCSTSVPHVVAEGNMYVHKMRREPTTYADAAATAAASDAGTTCGSAKSNVPYYLSLLRLLLLLQQLLLLLLMLLLLLPLLFLLCDCCY